MESCQISFCAMVECKRAFSVYRIYLLVSASLCSETVALASRLLPHLHSLLFLDDGSTHKGCVSWHSRGYISATCPVKDPDIQMS